MDNCSSCLVLEEARKLVTKEVRFFDFVDKPIYCRACYQRERVENERLRLALGDVELHANNNLVQGIARKALQEKPKWINVTKQTTEQ